MFRTTLLSQVPVGDVFAMSMHAPIYKVVRWDGPNRVLVRHAISGMDGWWLVTTDVQVVTH